jgi:hypothetical protein
MLVFYVNHAGCILLVYKIKKINTKKNKNIFDWKNIDIEINLSRHRNITISEIFWSKFLSF